MWKWKSKMISNKCWNVVNCFFVVNVWRKKIITKIRSQYYVLFQTNIDVEVTKRKNDLLSRLETRCEKLFLVSQERERCTSKRLWTAAKVVPRAISTLLQFLDTLFLIAASSIFIVTTYCTNIFDRNYIALFQEDGDFCLKLICSPTITGSRPITDCFFQIRWLSKSGLTNRFIDTLFLIVAATYFWGLATYFQ